MRFFSVSVHSPPFTLLCAPEADLRNCISGHPGPLGSTSGSTGRRSKEGQEEQGQGLVPHLPAASSIVTGTGLAPSGNVTFPHPFSPSGKKGCHCASHLLLVSHNPYPQPLQIIPSLNTFWLLLLRGLSVSCWDPDKYTHTA